MSSPIFGEAVHFSLSYTHTHTHTHTLTHTHTHRNTHYMRENAKY